MIYRTLSHTFGGHVGKKYKEKYHKLKDMETGPIKRRYYRMMSHIFGGRLGAKYSKKYHILKDRCKKTQPFIRTEVHTEIKKVFIPYDTSVKEILLVDTDSVGDYILMRNYIRYIKQSDKYKDYKITLLCSKLAEEWAKYLDSDIIDNFLVVPGQIQRRTDDELAVIKQDLECDGLKPFYDTICYCSFNSMPKRSKHEFILKDVMYNDSIIYMDEKNPHRNCSDLLQYTKILWNTDAAEQFECDLNKFFFERWLDVNTDVKWPTIEPSKVIIKNSFFNDLKNEYVVINPCANDEYRMWHRNNWIDVIKYIKTVKKLDVILVCGKDQEEYCRSILQDSGIDGTVFAGLAVGDLLQILKLAKLYIGQDSGIFHVAAALNIRTLCLSAGNAYFRFLQYPKTRKHVRVLFPRGVEEWINKNKDRDPALVRNINCFYINELLVPDVTSEIDKLLEIKDIIFVYKHRTENTGDLTICPYDYFPEYFDNFVVLRIDNDDIKKLHFKKSIFILGGGGLIDQNDTWNTGMNMLVDEKRTVIGWGIGFNHHTGKPAINVDVNLNKFSLLGLRDYNKKYPYLPCVSCLNKSLEKKYKVKRKFGCVLHYEHPDSEFDYPTEYNNRPFADIIKFIGESEIIITNTYHVMYWATLMNKKVIVFEAFSNKFDNFKYKPVKYSGNLGKDLKKVKSYPDAFAECTKANNEFFKKVKSLIDKA